MANDLASLFIKIDSKGVVTATKDLKKLEGESKKVEKATDQVTKSFNDQIRIVQALAAAYGLFKFGQYVKDATLLAARFETLGVVMRVVGNNAGFTAKQMDVFDRSLQSTGISMVQSRNNLVRMLQAQIDLTQATKLGRIAQDAAVIGNLNSSDAFEQLIVGIQRGMPRILRTIGLTVDFNRSYKELAEQLGVTVSELSDVERVQARVNEVMRTGTFIAGTYEAAMDTAGKQLLSLERHLDNLKVLFGAAFTPALAEIIEQITSAVKGMNSELEGDSKEAVEDWGVAFRLTIMSIEAEVLRLAALIDQVGGTLTAGAGLMVTALNVASGGLLGGDAAQSLAEMNVEFENRHNKAIAQLEELARKYVEVDDSRSDAAKERRKAEDDAAEARKLAQVEEAKREKETETRRLASLKEFTKAAEASFKRLSFARSLTGYSLAPNLLRIPGGTPSLGAGGSPFDQGPSAFGFQAGGAAPTIEETTEDLEDLGFAIQELGSFASNANNTLGRMTRDVGVLITQIGAFIQLQDDKASFLQTTAGGLSIAGVAAGIAIPLFQAIIDISKHGVSIDERQRISSERLATVSGIFRETGVGLPTVSTVELARIASNLEFFADGIESLGEAAAEYIAAFITDTERFVIQTRELESVFARIDDELPETRDGFKDLVEALDLTTEWGQRAYVILLQAADAADRYYTFLEKGAEEQLRNAESDLRKAFDAEKTRINDLYQAEMIVLRERLTATRTIIFDLAAGVDRLRRAKDRMFPLSLGQARGNITRVLEQARQGDFSGLSGLDRSLETVSGISTAGFSTAAEFQHEMQKNANLLAELESLTVGQLTIEEQIAEDIEKQIEHDTEHFNAQMGALNAQLNALLGINIGVLTIVEAINNLRGAQTNPNLPGGPGRQEGIPYFDSSGRLQYWTDFSGAMPNFMKGGSQFLNYSEYRNLTAGIRGSFGAFASGGTFSGGLRLVGEEGPELEFTGPSRIMSNQKTTAMLGGGDVVGELRALRNDIRGQVQIIRQNSGDSRKVLERWDGEGLPDTRTE